MKITKSEIEKAREICKNYISHPTDDLFIKILDAYEAQEAELVRARGVIGRIANNFPDPSESCESIAANYLSSIKGENGK